MKKIKIRKAEYLDKIKVLNFLRDNIKSNEDLNRETFDHNILDNKNNCGYLIEVDNLIQGFIGVLIKKNSYGDLKLTVGNMNNWIVSKNYRSYSLSLLKTYLNNNNMLITNFTASSNVQKILPMFGFKKMANNDYFFPLISGLFRNKLKYKPDISIVSETQKITKEVQNKFIDHKKYNCILIKIINNKKTTFIIIKNKKIIKNYFKCTQILYSNNYHEVINNIFYLNFFLFNKYKSIGIILSDHFLQKNFNSIFFLKKRAPKFIYYKNMENLEKKINFKEINFLYSELIF